MSRRGMDGHEMGRHGKQTLTIVNTNDEPFSRSDCQCEFCLSTHLAVAKWDSYIPVTRLQHRMKEAVARIDNMIATSDTSGLRVSRRH